MALQDTFTRALEQGVAESPATVPLSSMVCLLNEYFQYAQRTCKTVEEIENKMSKLGVDAGRPLWTYVRMLDRMRSKTQDTVCKLTRPDTVLYYLKETVWPILFGKPAADIKKPATEDLEYYLVDEWPVLEYYTSYPPNYGGALPSMFVAGLVEGFLTCCGFRTKILAYNVLDEPNPNITFHISFTKPDRKSVV